MLICLGYIWESSNVTERNRVRMSLYACIDHLYVYTHGTWRSGAKKKLISVHGPTQHSITQLGMAWCLQEFLRLLVFFGRRHGRAMGSNCILRSIGYWNRLSDEAMCISYVVSTGPPTCLEYQRLGTEGTEGGEYDILNKLCLCLIADYRSQFSKDRELLQRH
jgi:hypothetical protein